MKSDFWPELPLEAWIDTHATLHLWMQIIGKIRLRQSPWINHGWSVTLYVTSRGLTTNGRCLDRGSHREGHLDRIEQALAQAG